MNRAEIKRAYAKLLLIIYRDKYLIPKKPSRPINAYFQYLHKEKDHIIQQYDLQSISGTQKMKRIHEIVKENIRKDDPNFLLCKQQYQKKIQDHKEAIQKYNQKYINPVKIYRKYNPFACFVNSRLKEEAYKNKSIVQIVKQWKGISQAQKNKINQISLDKINQNIKQYEIFVQNHRIPELKNVAATNIFVSENYMKEAQLKPNEPNKKNTPITKQLMQKYAKLPNEEKQRYKRLAQERIEQSEVQYNNFLKKWNLTHSQLLHIQQICKKYNNKIKMSKKLLNPDIIEDEQSQVYEQDEESDDTTSPIDQNDIVTDTLKKKKNK